MKIMNLKIAALAGILILGAGLSACDCSGGADAEGEQTRADGRGAGDSAGAENADKSEGPEHSGADENPAARPSAKTPGTATLTPTSTIDLSRVLREEDLSEFESGAIARSPLPGKAIGPNYNATRFHSGSGVGYGLGLQVWKFDSDQQAVDYVQTMRAQFLSTADAPMRAPVSGARGFLSSRDGMEVFVFAPERAEGKVAAISCDATFCKSGWDDLQGVAQKVSRRMQVAAPGRSTGQPQTDTQPQKDDAKPTNTAQRPQPAAHQDVAQPKPAPKPSKEPKAEENPKKDDKTARKPKIGSPKSLRTDGPIRPPTNQLRGRASSSAGASKIKSVGDSGLSLPRDRQGSSSASPASRREARQEARRERGRGGSRALR